MAINFCTQCGARVELGIPPGDDRPRPICTVCHTVHYENPKMVVGCIPEWDNRILMCRRAIEPRYGLWTIPAGYLENGETLFDGAKRETHEEAGADVDIIALYSIFDLPRINQVYLIFRARLINGRFRAGEESLEVRLFRERDIPWDEIAFLVIKESLRFYYQDRQTGDYPLRFGRIPAK